MAQGQSATGTIAKFLKDDPNPPNMRELKEFFESITPEEREQMARSLGWEPEAE